MLGFCHIHGCGHAWPQTYNDQRDCTGLSEPLLCANVKNTQSFLSDGVLLTLCMLGNFSCFRSHLQNFFFKKKFRNTIRVSDGLVPVQGPNCLQKVICRGNKLPVARRELMFYHFLITYLVL